MEKYFNTISVITGLIGGVAVSLLGGWDTILRALFFLIIADYLTGLLKAIFTKTLSSQVSFKGLFKKMLIMLIVAVTVELQKVIGAGIPLREIVITFYIANEGISFLENVSEFIPLPAKLKQVFEQLREKGEDD